MEQTINISKSGRNHSIDYLKALSVAMVIFTHYAWPDKTTLFFTLVIAMAVPIFQILTGYNFTMSRYRKMGDSSKQLWDPRLLGRRLQRFLTPFLVIYLLEMLMEYIQNDKLYSPVEYLRLFITGGLGPGSYYVPVLVVLTLVFPLIYLAVHRLSYWGIMLTALVNLAYECYVLFSHMDRELYRLLFFRYLLYVALGCYLYFHTQNKTKYPLSKILLFVMFVLGLTFSVAVYQFHWKPPIFRYWTKTAMPLALYIFPLLVLFLHLVGNRKLPIFLDQPLEYMGRASYHIFLIQMIYYRYFDHLVFPAKPAIPVVCGNLLICLTLGCGYYWLDGTLSKKLPKLRSARGART